MRLRHDPSPLPRQWSGHPSARGLLAEADIRVCGSGRLAAKLLVFSTPAALNRFWVSGLRRPGLGKHTVGAVNSLMTEMIPVRGPSHVRADPRYFCIVGLTRNNLSMEVICHEAVHAGMAYARRVKRSPWSEALDFDEEAVAYPAGRIAAAINRFLHDSGLYQE